MELFRIVRGTSSFNLESIMWNINLSEKSSKTLEIGLLSSLLVSIGLLERSSDRRFAILSMFCRS